MDQTYPHHRFHKASSPLTQKSFSAEKHGQEGLEVQSLSKKEKIIIVEFARKVLRTLNYEEILSQTIDLSEYLGGVRDSNFKGIQRGKVESLLNELHIKTYRDLVQQSTSEVSSQCSIGGKKVGYRTFQSLKKILSQQGLYFGMDVF